MPRLLLLLFLVCAWTGAHPLRAEETNGAEQTDETSAEIADAASRVTRGVADPGLRGLIEEALRRNPGLSAAGAEARAATWRAEQAGGLPDMTAMLTAFVETPETRVGPQQLTATIGQQLPWAGKRALAGDVEAHGAEAMAAVFEGRRLGLVTEVRRLAYELAFVARRTEITRIFRSHLLRHEEIARSRYATGGGAGQDVLKMQAEITRVEQRLLRLETRSVSLTARLNELCDRRPGERVPRAPLEASSELNQSVETLLHRALMSRPELRAAESRIAGAETRAELAQRRFRPDFRVGITYTLVGDREDLPGRLQPPPDNGNDILGVQGGISIPLWRKQRTAGLEEALELRSAAESERSQVVTRIAARLGDLTEEIRLTWRERRLLEDLLVVQAEEALESAQAAYVAGTLSALELFDAEHVLFEAQTAVARAAADYLILIAELEGAVGEPIRLESSGEAS